MSSARKNVIRAIVRNYGQGVDDDELVTTSVAAKTLGVAARTLQHWTRVGLVTPTKVLPSGHARWRVSDLDRQVQALAAKRT